MQTVVTRVLVVDDHEPWRRRISALVGQRDGWQVIDEAADGLAAIQKAETLRPDLILLDIELPAVNGLDVVRRILSRAPGTRILFLSAHRSWDIVEVALATGARGYMLKTEVGHELAPAMKTVRDGGRFVSAMLAGRGHERDAVRLRRHEAWLHSDDTLVLNEYVRLATAALDAGQAFIVVANASRRNELAERLHASGVDMSRAIREGRYRPIDTADALSPLMVDGWPDEARFWTAGTALMMAAARASRGARPRIVACGDGAASLFRAGNAAAAIRLEQLWDDLTRAYNVDVFCGYCTHGAPYDTGSNEWQRICRAHSAVHR